jgi:uncharacterized protein
MSLEVRAGAPALEPTMLDTEPAMAEAAEGPAGPPALPDGSAPSAAERPRALPVAAAERLFAVDALRGFALLGILAMNIVDFGWPGAAYSNPLRGGGFAGTDRAIWYFNHLVFEGKMMTIFSMLFGAGLVLMDQRAAGRGASVRGVYYRRVLWLLAIGLVHAYLIWSGDILVMYASCGLLLYLFRNRTPKTLIILGVSTLLIFVPIVVGFVAGIDYMKAATARVQAQQKAGETPAHFDQRLHDFWTRNLQEHFSTSPEKQEKSWNEEMAAYRGGYIGIVKHRAVGLIFGQTLGFLLFGLWFAGGRMLLGMGLMKFGVFSAERSVGFYRRLALVGYGVGLPLVICDIAIEWYYGFFQQNPVFYFTGGWWLIQAISSPFLALGHVAMVMLLFQSGAASWLVRRLAAVGRMALTNYLLTSIICTTIFYGYGFGLYGRLHRPSLYLVVIGVWAVLLAISLPWLERFRFGPAEWAWRSLTYGRPQPFLRREQAAS